MADKNQNKDPRKNQTRNFLSGFFGPKGVPGQGAERANKTEEYIRQMRGGK